MLFLLIPRFLSADLFNFVVGWYVWYWLSLFLLIIPCQVSVRWFFASIYGDCNRYAVLEIDQCVPRYIFSLCGQVFWTVNLTVYCSCPSLFAFLRHVHGHFTKCFLLDEIWVQILFLCLQKGCMHRFCMFLVLRWSCCLFCETLWLVLSLSRDALGQR